MLLKNCSHFDFCCLLNFFELCVTVAFLLDDDDGIYRGKMLEYEKLNLKSYIKEIMKKEKS